MRWLLFPTRAITEQEHPWNSSQQPLGLPASTMVPSNLSPCCGHTSSQKGEPDSITILMKIHPLLPLLLWLRPTALRRAERSPWFPLHPHLYLLSNSYSGTSDLKHLLLPSFQVSVLAASSVLNALLLPFLLLLANSYYPQGWGNLVRLTSTPLPQKVWVTGRFLSVLPQHAQLPSILTDNSMLQLLCFFVICPTKNSGQEGQML